VKQRAEETGLKRLYALWLLRRHQLHRLLLLLYPLPRGLPEVLMELYQDGSHGLCTVLL
jgi:hypothetical protein